MKLFIHSACLLLCIVLMPSVTAEPLKTSYLVGTDEQFRAPYSWVDGENFRGASRELLDAFAEYQGIEFVYVSLPYARCNKLLQLDQIDLLYPDDPRWAPELKMGWEYTYSEGAFAYGEGLFVLGEPQTQVAKLSTVGALRGWTLPPFQARIDRGELQVKRYLNLEQLLAGLRAGAVDAVYMNQAIMQDYISSKPLYETVVYAETGPAIKGWFHLSTLENQGLIEAFNQFLLARPETVDAIRQRYGLGQP